MSLARRKGDICKSQRAHGLVAIDCHAGRQGRCARPDHGLRPFQAAALADEILHAREKRNGRRAVAFGAQNSVRDRIGPVAALVTLSLIPI